MKLHALFFSCAFLLHLTEEGGPATANFGGSLVAPPAPVQMTSSSSSSSLLPRPVQLGPRPFWLVEDMADSELKRELQACASSRTSYQKSDFSIGHRGAGLMFPEHTKESYSAAARMGAGILECDVTFTKDLALVCRHSQCDMHTTTNVLLTDLAVKCTEPFSPAKDGQPASAKCCVSDFTVEEFKSLCGKMDASNPNATTVEGYLDGTPGFRTDLYASPSSCPTLMTHAESITLFKELGVKYAPELKEAMVAMPYDGSYSQEDFAQQMVDEYKAAGVPAEEVYVQSYNYNDVLYWIGAEPDFGEQAVYLFEERNDTKYVYDDLEGYFTKLVADGLKIIAPPLPTLIALPAGGTSFAQVVPSAYARAAKAAGLELITWTMERSGFLASGGGFYYSTVTPLVHSDGAMFEVMHVLAQDVGVLGIFTDWPSTVTFYANCIPLVGHTRRRARWWW